MVLGIDNKYWLTDCPGCGSKVIIKGENLDTPRD